MKKIEVIQNLKCGGCANTIESALGKIDGISEVKVNIENSTVEFETKNEETIALIESKLNDLGYPIDSDPNSLLKKAKSYVSCAVGRMGDKS